MELILERRLVERARKGDMVAFEQLYRAYKDALYHRVIRPRTRHSADAEDVLVDTFTTAMQRLDSYQDTGRSIFSWLARIAANKAYDVGRRAARDERRRTALEEQGGGAELAPQPDQAVIAQADRAAATVQVEEVLGLVSERYAQALRLRLLQDRSREECAQIMDIKIGTFDVVLLRATRAFKKQWAARYGPSNKAGDE